MWSLLCFFLSLLSRVLLHSLRQCFRSEQSFKHGKQNDETCMVGEKELRRELMPRHVAVIMDGNRRWAKQAGLHTSRGHEAGAKRLIEVAELCFNLGVDTVSAFAFSTENWGRDKEIRVSVIGNLEKIPEFLLRTIKEVEEATKCYPSKHLILAINYSGRLDILSACKSIVRKAEQGLIREEEVDETMLERELLTKITQLPSPDLLIRTSGEQRISNFFLWQLAYSELFFSPVHWPDFDNENLLKALLSYQCRERRFGSQV